MDRNAGVPELRRLLRYERTRQGLSREAVANLASELPPYTDLQPWQVQDLETRAQRIPPPEILGPVCQALGIDSEKVAGILGMKW